MVLKVDLEYANDVRVWFKILLSFFLKEVVLGK